MKLKIIAVGKLKEKYLKLGIQEYKKRLNAYTNLEILEVKDYPAPQRLSEKEVLQVKKKEGELILNKIKDRDYVVCLDIPGKEMDSIAFSKWLGSLRDRGTSHLVFVIGGSNGLSKEVLDRANEAISFSKLTFPHQLMRLILLEQIYRGFRIDAGHSYHK